MGFLSDIGNKIQGAAKYFENAKSQVLSPIYVKGKEDAAEAFPNVTDVKPEKWNAVLPYGFKVQTITGGEVDGFSKDGFMLPINPSDLNQDETFAINITPTQGGISTEHNSIVFRELLLNGTTGVVPFRGTGGANDKGKPILGDPAKLSGYECFLALRNYFAAYADFKKKGDSKSKDVHLFFINRKDSVTYVVEPVKFSLKRSSARATLYDYSIQLKMLDISRVENDENPSNWLSKIEDTANLILNKVEEGRGIVISATNTIDQIEKTASGAILEVERQISLVVTAAANGANTIMDAPATFWNTTSKATVRNFNDAIDAVNGVVNRNAGAGEKSRYTTLDQEKIQAENAKLTGAGFTLNSLLADRDLQNVNAIIQSELSRLNKQSFEDHKTTLSGISNNLANAYGLGSPVYDTYNSAPPASDSAEQKTPTSKEIAVLDTLGTLQAIIDTILTDDKLFKTPIDENLININDNFNKSLQLTVPNSVNSLTIQHNTTLEDLAAQYLGSADQWVIIAILNKLKPPYIDDSSTDPQVKHSGDKILIPSSVASDVSSLITSKEYPINIGLSETEKNMGIDLKLTNDFDLTLTNLNDLDLISGGSNLGQTIALRMRVEQGELKYHTKMGMTLPVGEKTVSAEAVYDALRQAILQDSRFSNINDLQVLIEDNVITIKLNLQVKELAQPVPLMLKL